MKLTKNFTLGEFTKSQTASRFGIVNTPSEKEIDALKELCVHVLQPLRDKFGAVTINSGFRCTELNQKIGSSATSQHVLGEAADIEIIGYSNYDIACWIRDHLVYDKVILEFYNRHSPNSGWIHVTYRKHHLNRKESYRIGKEGTQKGLG